MDVWGKSFPGRKNSTCKSQVSVRRHKLCTRSCSKCWTYNQILNPHTSSRGRWSSHPPLCRWENWGAERWTLLMKEVGVDQGSSAPETMFFTIISFNKPGSSCLRKQQPGLDLIPLPWHVPLHCAPFKTQEEGKTCTQEKKIKWLMQGSSRSTRWSMTWGMTFVKETKGLCSSYHLFLHTTLSFSSILPVMY